MYQGYANYPTFTVALWIDNDRERKELQREHARMLIRGDEETRDVEMAEWLQEQVQSSFDEEYVTAIIDESDGVAGTFLNHVMNSVDWLGLAREYIRDEKEKDNGP